MSLFLWTYDDVQKQIAFKIRFECEIMLSI